MAIVRSLAEHEFQKEAAELLGSVFISTDPFDQPVSKSVHHRAIMFPVPYVLDEAQLKAMVVAARAVGDRALYVTITERPDGANQDRPYHWHVPLERMDSYRGLEGFQGVLENALYSDRGTWGILVSHESHAVVAGERLFVETLFSHLPSSLEAQSRAFLSEWKHNQEHLGSDLGWLPGLLKHVFSDERAKELLLEAQIAL